METIRVQLDWFANTNHTGLLLAAEEGWFAAAGLDVEIDGEVHSSFDTHGADIILGPQVSMLETRGAVTCIATITQRCDSGLVSLADAGITRPRDLEGKRLTHWSARWFHELIGTAVELDGGDYAKVMRVPMDVGDIVSTLGAVADATWVYENWEVQELKSLGHDVNFIRLADLGPLWDFCAPSYAATRAMEERRPDVLARFMEVVERGYREACAHPAEVVQRLRHRLPAVPMEMLVASQRHLAAISLDANGRWGTITPERWNTLANWMVDRGMMDQRRETEYTNAFLPQGVPDAA